MAKVHSFIANLFKSVRSAIKNRLNSIKAGFDIRDIFVFGGLAMLGYGLYLLRPWLAFTIVGIICMALGLGLFSWMKVSHGNS